MENGEEQMVAIIPSDNNSHPPQTDKPQSSREPNPELSSTVDFPSFCRLPTELRLQIWHLVPRPPRVVNFTYRPPTQSISLIRKLLARVFRRSSPVNPIRISSTVPPLLHTCSESRQLMQTYYYTRTFASLVGNPAIWFNYSTDTLSLHDISCWLFEPPYYSASPDDAFAQALAPVQNLIVEDRKLRGMMRFVSECMQVLEDPARLHFVVPDLLVSDFKIFWLSWTEAKWAEHCEKVARGEDGRKMTRQLEISIEDAYENVSDDSN